MAPDRRAQGPSGRRLTVAVTSFELPPLSGWGGLGTYTFHLTEALAELGHRVFCVACTSGPRRTEERRGSLTVVRLPRRERRYPLLRQTLNSLVYARNVGREVERLVREEGVELVQFPEYRAEGVHYLRRARVPTVVRFALPQFLVWDLNSGGARGVVPPADRTRSLTLDQRRMTRLESEAAVRATALLSPSRSLADLMGERLGTDRRIHVVPNGLDTQRYTPEGPPSTWRGRLALGADPVVLYTGRLEHRKGVHVLLEAAGAFLKRVPSAHLVLAGADNDSAPDGGSMRAHLERRAREQDVADRVHFLGPIAAAAMPDLYRLGTVFCSPSLYENFGNVNIEALSSGLPVVTTAAGGPTEIFRPGVDALLVEPADPHALAEAITGLLLDAEQRAMMARAARERALERFDRRTMARATAAFYQEVIDEWHGERGGAAPAAPARTARLARS